MARAAKRRKHTRQTAVKRYKIKLPFTVHNYALFGIGIFVLIIGYIFLGIKPVDSFWSLTLAPIILIIGYVIILPLSFLYQHKSLKQKPEMQDKPSTNPAGRQQPHQTV